NIVLKLEEVFKIFPLSYFIVSDRWDEQQLKSLGILTTRVREGGFGTDAEAAFSEYVIHKDRIMDDIQQLKKRWDFKLMIASVNLCGGTSGIALPLVNDVLDNFDDIKCLMFLKIPTSSFSTWRQLMNIEFFFTKYKNMKRIGKLSLMLYTDEGYYGAMYVDEWMSDFISCLIASLTAKMGSVANTLKQLCEFKQNESSFEQAIGAPFILDSEKSVEEGLPLIESSLRNLKSQLKGSLLNVDFDLASPYHLFGVLCYPNSMNKNESEEFELRKNLANIVEHSMGQKGLKGFQWIEPVPFGKTWKLYGMLRGLKITNIKGIEL
ncbi:MAG: hypothetical protein ACPLSM_05655, partial [Thermosphaera sp.]